MSNKAPWPVRKGIFRSSGQSDFVPQRTPSPVVELPNTPTPQPGRTTNPLSPLFSIVDNPLSPPLSPTSVAPSTPLSPLSRSNPLSPKSPTSPISLVDMSVRQIPIEVEHEVITIDQMLISLQYHNIQQNQFNVGKHNRLSRAGLIRFHFQSVHSKY